MAPANPHRQASTTATGGGLAESAATGAEAVEWSLADLYGAPDDPRLRADLEDALTAAHTLAEQIRGRVAELSADELAPALAERERIESIVDRARAFAELLFAADTSDEARGALVQFTLERGTAVENELLFFDLEWVAAEDAHADAVIASATRRRSSCSVSCSSSANASSSVIGRSSSRTRSSASSWSYSRRHASRPVTRFSASSRSSGSDNTCGRYRRAARRKPR